MVQAGSFKTRVPVLAKYEVKEEIGHGGMATVYRAHDPRLARDVAIKVIHPHLRDSPEVAHRFYVEAKAVAKLRHTNIVEVFDVSAPEEAEHYLVVELVRGDTLRKTLQRHGALPPEVAAAIGIELLAALAHAHGAGVVHRDIKPENVMVEHAALPEGGAASAAGHSTPPPTSKPRTTPSEGIGDRVKVKLTDFGIAKLLDAQGVTSTGQVLGSPAHMAPEQIEGNEVDARADVFSLGVLLYECMVGHLPFEGSNPAQVLRRVLEGIYPSAEREKPEVGRKWSAILDRALAHDVNDRFPDAVAMRDALCEELKRLGIPSPRGEIEAYFDDPEGFTERHKKQTIAELCQLAGKARREGNAVAAAADYNRALAYAPEDRELLKIVSSMHKAEARRRMIRRVAPPIVGAIALGFAAFAIARVAEKKHPIDPLPSATASHVAATASATPSSAPSDTAVTTATTPIPISTVPIQARTALPRKVERNVTIGTLRPEFGVKIALDGAAAADASRGYRLTLDGEKHTLAFTCAADACAPLERVVLAGDKDETIDIALKIRPASLTVVKATPGYTYRITEENLTFSAGVPINVPMESGQRTVHVVEFPSNRTATIMLHAGKSETLDMSTAATPQNP